MVKEIKDNEYEQIVKDNKKVVIDCFATWCGPCRMLSPVLDSISEELKDVTFVKIDVDNAEKITSEYQIMSIPTLLIFEDGKLKEKVVGLKSKTELIDLIK
jgi:thioredoxin 1